MNKNNKVFQTLNNYYHVCGEVRKECTKFVADIVKYWGKDGFPLSSISQEFDIDVADVSVVYDGGNHPEYASSVCSQVFSVYADEKGRISLHTEDCADYDQDRIETVDLTTLVDGVNVAVMTITEELLKLLCSSFEYDEEKNVMTISKSDFGLIADIKENEDIKEWFRDNETWEFDEFCELIYPTHLAAYLSELAEVDGDKIVFNFGKESNEEPLKDNGVSHDTIEKLSWLLSSHYNMYHADMILRAAFDDSISQTDFLRGCVDIHQSEKDTDDTEFSPKGWENV